MAAVQADLLVPPPTADRFVAPGDSHFGHLAKACGVMRAVAMAVGRTVGAMHRSRSMMGCEPMDRVQIADRRKGSSRTAVRGRISSNGLHEMTSRRALRATAGLNGFPYL